MSESISSENGFARSSDGYEYELRLTEDLNDGRYHEELENWSRKKMKSVIAEKGYIEGRVRHIPIHKVILPKFLLTFRLQGCFTSTPEFY